MPPAPLSRTRDHADWDGAGSHGSQQSLKEFARCREFVKVRLANLTNPGTDALLARSVDMLQCFCHFVVKVWPGLAKPQSYRVTPRENPCVLRRRLRRNIKRELRTIDPSEADLPGGRGSV